MGADHYETLSVPRDADAAEIKAAHRRAVSKHHPDAGGDREKFEEVQTAYLVLRDPDARARYDRGEDPGTGPDNRAAMVTQMAIKAFMKAVSDGDTEHDDMIATARRDLEQQADKAAHALEVLAEQKKTWDDALGRISRDEAVGPNFLRQAIDTQIRSIEDERRRISDHAGKIADAVEMLEGFEYRVDEDAEPEFADGWDPRNWDHSSNHSADSMAYMVEAMVRQQRAGSFFQTYGLRGSSSGSSSTGQEPKP